MAMNRTLIIKMIIAAILISTLIELAEMFFSGVFSQLI